MYPKEKIGVKIEVKNPKSGTVKCDNYE